MVQSTYLNPNFYRTNEKTADLLCKFQLCELFVSQQVYINYRIIGKSRNQTHMSIFDLYEMWTDTRYIELDEMMHETLTFNLTIRRTCMRNYNQWNVYIVYIEFNRTIQDMLIRTI